MWFGVVLSWCVVDNLSFRYCIEFLFVSHEGTDSLAEFSNLDAYILQYGVSSPLSHDHDCLWMHLV